MRTSEQIADLAAALAKAQAKIEGAVKDKENPGFRGAKYADLGAVWDAIRAPLTDNGLSVTQWLRSTETGVEVETLLLHATGQYMADVFAVPVGKRDAQGYGSAATYARRYALMAAVGIAPVDDDGNAAVGPPAFAKVGLGDVKAEVEREHNAGKPLASQYQTDKAKKAAEWVTAAIEAVSKLPTERAIGEWWGERQTTIDKLEREHPAEFDRLTVAVDARRDQVPSVLAAG
jgi:hypothetical protein